MTELLPLELEVLSKRVIALMVSGASEYVEVSTIWIESRFQCSHSLLYGREGDWYIPSSLPLVICHRLLGGAGCLIVYNLIDTRSVFLINIRLNFDSLYFLSGPFFRLNVRQHQVWNSIVRNIVYVLLFIGGVWSTSVSYGITIHKWFGKFCL